MHLDSFSESESPDFNASDAGGGLSPPSTAPTAETGVNKRRLIVKGDAERSGAAMECVSDLSGFSDLSHASYSRCLVLVEITRLMETVRSANPWLRDCESGGQAGVGERKRV
jgi:hypothetical protein